jgi:hypothetical protein
MFKFLYHVWFCYLSCFGNALFILVLQSLIDPYPIGYLAIYGIQGHMNGQAKTHKSKLWYKAERNVNSDKPQLMQWMETDATAAWVVYGVGE